MMYSLIIHPFTVLNGRKVLGHGERLQSASRCPCNALLRQPDTCISFGTPPTSVFDVAMARYCQGEIPDSSAPGSVQNGHVFAKLQELA